MFYTQRTVTPIAERRVERPNRVLIADDYFDAAESLAMLVELAGLKTRVARRGDEALAQAMQWRPQVCVLDIDMPGCNGRDIARRLRQLSWAQRPLLIAVSGWTSIEERQRAFDAGFDYYFIKPMEPTELVRIIRNGCAGVIRLSRDS
jgi:DNA-binding response OmpR family regulator